MITSENFESAPEIQFNHLPPKASFAVTLIPFFVRQKENFLWQKWKKGIFLTYYGPK